MTEDRTAPKPPRQTSLVADVVLVSITAIWGVTFVTVKDALALADPFTFLSLRFALGGGVLAVLAGRAMANRRAWLDGAVLAVFLFGGFVLQTYGLLFTSASRSAFITGLCVLLVPIASLLLFRRWPLPPVFAGILCAVGGLYLLTGGDLSRGSLLGDGLTLGCAVIYAFHIALTEKMAPRSPVAALVGVQLLLCGVLSVLCLPLVEIRLVNTPALWGAVALCGLLASALAQGLQTWAQRKTTAVRAALLFSLEPVFAALWAASLGRERLGAREMGGGALILLGVVVAELGSVLWARRVTDVRLAR